MAKIQHLAHPPITEAIIDFRFKQKSSVSFDSITNYSKQFSTKLPNQKPIRHFTQTFKYNSDSSKQEYENILLGQRLESTSGEDIVQFRRDGFTFSKVNSYTKWENVYDTATKYWENFQTHYGLDVTRIAVRYINNFKIKTLPESMTEYFSAPPSFPEKFPEQINRYVTQLQASFDSSTLANIIQSYEFKGNEIFYLLDIDVYKNVNPDMPTEALSDQLDKLREFKNNIFFESLTDKTIALFN